VLLREKRECVRPLLVARVDDADSSQQIAVGCDALRAFSSVIAYATQTTRHLANHSRRPIEILAYRLDLPQAS
jgi:hypothetical protein